MEADPSRKAMLWQTVTDQFSQMDMPDTTDDMGGAFKQRGRPSALPFLPPRGAGSRSGLSGASTGRGSSIASSRCSSVYSRDSSACSESSSRAPSSRAPSTPGSRRSSKRSNASSSFPSCHSASANPSFKASVWDAVADDDDKAPEVEKIDDHAQKPVLPKLESQVLPALVGVAWQDPQEADLDKCRMAFSPGAKHPSMTKREFFDLPASDSRPESRLSDWDGALFNNMSFDDRADSFNVLDGVGRDPFDDLDDLRVGSPMMPTPPSGLRKAPPAPRPKGQRKLPPVSLEAADAALSAALGDVALTSARSGRSSGSAASSMPAAAVPPPIKNAWAAAPEQPQAPPPANRYTRPGMRPQMLPRGDALADTEDAHTKLSL